MKSHVKKCRSSFDCCRIPSQRIELDTSHISMRFSFALFQPDQFQLASTRHWVISACGITSFSMMADSYKYGLVELVVHMILGVKQSRKTDQTLYRRLYQAHAPPGFFRVGHPYSGAPPGFLKKQTG